MVLGLVHGAEEFVAAGLRVVTHTGVVAGGDALGTDLARGDEELIELHVIVAHGAGDGRAAFEVVRDEGLDYIKLEFAFEIHDVERNAEMFGYAASVVDIVVRAAAMLSGAVIFELGQAALVPELHRQANDGLGAVVEDGGNGGAVHAAAHGDCDGVGGGDGWLVGCEFELGW